MLPSLGFGMLVGLIAAMIAAIAGFGVLGVLLVYALVGSVALVAGAMAFAAWSQDTAHVPLDDAAS